MGDKVSLVIPVHNGERFLPRLYETLAAITYSNTEIVFVDNNSTDSSLIKLQELSHALHQFETRIVQERAKGAGPARNQGAKVSSGKFLSFLDCDDTIAPHKIESDLELLTNSEADFIFSRGYRVYKKGKILEQPSNRIKSGLNEPPSLGIVWLDDILQMPTFGTLLLTKELFFEIGGFPTILIGEDTVLMIRLGLNYSGYFNDEVLYTYNRHSDSTMSRAQRDGSSKAAYVTHLLQMISDPLIAGHPAALKIIEFGINLALLKNGYLDSDELRMLVRKAGFTPSGIANNYVSHQLTKTLGIFKNPFYWIFRFMHQKS